MRSYDDGRTDPGQRNNRRMYRQENEQYTYSQIIEDAKRYETYEGPEYEYRPRQNGAHHHAAKKKKKRRKKKSCLGQLLKFLLILLLLVAVAAIILKVWVIKPPAVSTDIGGRADSSEATIEPEKATATVDRTKNIYTFVILGMDDGNGNTDTIMLASFDADSLKMNVVSIPRDTLVNVSWNVKKANTLYSYGGIDQVMDGIGDLCGFQPDFYVRVNLEAFEVLVNAIGGVYFDVPMDMDYEDPAQDLYIHIPAGEQYLDGYDSMCVMRFRSGYANADIGRIETQQRFLKTAAVQILQNVGSIDISTLANVFLDYVDTDLTYGNLMWLGAQFMKMDSENIQFSTMPGNYTDYIYESSYVTIDVEEWLTLLNLSFNPFDREIREEDLDILTRNEYGDIYATSGVYAGDAGWGNW